MTPQPRPQGKLTKFLDRKVSLLAGAAGAAYFLQAVFNEFGLSAWLRWSAIVAGTVLTASAVVVNHLDRKRRDRRLADAEEVAKQARQESTAETRSAIELGITKLVNIAAERKPNQRRTMAEHLKQLIVSIACDLKPNARASYFGYDDSGAKKVLQWERVSKHGANRNDPPREMFEEGDEGPGDEMLRIMNSGEVKFVEDVSEEPFHLRQGQRGNYKTYIAAPVIVNGKKFGFLGVDAPEVGDLTREEVDITRVLAKVLAVGLWIAAKRSPSPKAGGPVEQTSSLH